MGIAPIDAAGWTHRGQRIALAPYAPAVAGGLLGLAAIVETVSRLLDTGQTGPYIVLLCLLGLATTAPLGAPQRTVAALALTAASVLSLAAFHTLTAAGIAAAPIAAYRSGRGGRPPVAVLLGAPYLVLALTDPPDRYARTVAIALASVVPLAAGVGVVRRVRREDAESRAAQHAMADTLLEHTARRERARIARELHDVVAHHISMIAVQAENARLTTPGMPSAGAQRLSAIGDTARAALTEMRRLLGVLREDASTEVADRRPQPGLRQLAELLDEARDATRAGTRLILRGAPVALDPGVELAAYRIVQEALTNSRRHAPGAAVDVELHYTRDTLRLLIRDNGPGPSGPAAAGGHGLLGMRERAAAVGGELRTGPAGTSGFLVEATLPAATDGTR
ncbi:sensor histidine kinase [Rugosimonospora africana]|uniref:sensor histidine kinase n=1 Tax=Rugosimonospora africana TaxID=556532 RepID=UPI001EF2187E|nr:histidine kinase [Rugosimonospora africana]